VSINYRRISLRPFTRPDSVWFLPVGFRQGQYLRPATSKDTTRIARAHQERHTRHAWEGLVGMGVSPRHVPCHTWEAHRMHLRSLWNCKTFLFQMVVTSCISVQYLRKYGFAKSSGNLYAPCILVCGNKLPTRCNRGFYCSFYCLLNIFRAPLCPSSGAQEYYTVVAGCGISCCGFQFAGLVCSWGLCVRFVGCFLQQLTNRTHNSQLYTRPTTWKPQHQIPQAATTV